MLKWKALLAAAIGLAAALPALQAQKAAKSPALTPLDIIEIQQLVIRYAYGLDTAADDGHLYSDVFTPDGEFVGRQVPLTIGREALARVSRSVRKGNSQYVRHFITNHIIDPSPEGAKGKVYLMVVDCEEDQPSSIYIAGHYEDVYVKTADGWRIKYRDARGMGPPRAGGGGVGRQDGAASGGRQGGQGQGGRGGRGRGAEGGEGRQGPPPPQ